MTLRGSILEDAVASTGKHGTVRGLPLKDVLEQVVPELNVSCLRLALSTAKVTEQLLKLDEQGVSLMLLRMTGGQTHFLVGGVSNYECSLKAGCARIYR